MKRNLHHAPVVIPSLLLLLALLLSGCDLLAATPQPAGTVLFSDAFESDSGAWKTTLQDDGSMIGLQAGGLRFVLNTPQQDFFSVLKDDYADLTIDVDMLKMNGPDDNLMGVVCRLQDLENYYAFLITSDAYYGIARVVDGQYILLNNTYMENNIDIIQQGIDSNHVRVGCVQNALWLEVNGVMLAAAYDDTFTDGRAGLMAGSASVAGVDVLFDNFTITQP